MQRRSATPFGINAVLALAAVVGGLLLPQYLGTLAGRLLAMQMLVVHAVAMLYGFASGRRKSLAEGKQGDAKIFTVALWTMYATYPLAAWSIGGPFGLVEFVALGSGTFLGAWDDKHNRRERLQIGVRWAVAFAALLVATQIFGFPSNLDRWPGASGSVAAAGLYFGALAAAEAAPQFYRRLAARSWVLYRRYKRLAEASQRSSKD